MRTLRLSYEMVIAQVGKRGQGNSGRDGIPGGDRVSASPAANTKIRSIAKR